MTFYNRVKFGDVQLCPIYYPLTATFRVSFSCVFSTILQVICMSSDVFVLTSFQCLSDFMIQALLLDSWIVSNHFAVIKSTTPNKLEYVISYMCRCTCRTEHQIGLLGQKQKAVVILVEIARFLGYACSFNLF